MSRLLLLICLACFVVGEASAQTAPLGQRAAERLYRILTNENDDVATRLEKLSKLAANRSFADRDRAYITVEYAGLLMQEERYEEAQSALEAVLVGQDEDFEPPIRLAYARALLIVDDIDGALAQFEIWRRAEAEPDENSLFLLAFAYFRTDQFAKCIEIMEPIVAANEFLNTNRIELLAFAYAQSGRVDRAVELMLDLVERTPEKQRAWKSLSGFYQMNEELGPAAGSLATAGELDSLGMSEASYLARIYAMLGLPDEGAATMQAALDEEEEAPAYKDLMLLARLHVQARNFDAAIAAFQRAATAGEDGEPFLNLGQLYLHWERYEEAIDMLENSIQFFGEEVPAEVYYLLAIAAINNDSMDVARNALLQIEEDEQYGTRAANLKNFLAN